MFLKYFSYNFFLFFFWGGGGGGAERGYRRIGLISACAYHSRWKGNMRLLKKCALITK